MGSDDEKAAFRDVASEYKKDSENRVMKNGFKALFGIIGLFLFALYGITGLILGIIYFFTDVI